MRRYVAEPATDFRCEHAEGPCWDGRSGHLLWVDQFAGLVHAAEYAPTGVLRIARTYRVGHPVGAVVPCLGEAAGWMLACANGFGYLGADGQVRLLAQPETSSATPMRMNDGKCDATGAFWAGSMAWAKTSGAGHLYRLARTGELRVARANLTISNGLAWSADGRWMYHIDTPTQRIDRFAVRADGDVTWHDSVVTIDPALGNPDGMCIDTDGCLWVALWNGSAVHRYAPDGELLAVVDVDAPLVSSCCLGGPDGRTLFVTTSQENMTTEERARHGRSGLVFRVAVEASGLPAAGYAPSGWL